MKPTRTRITHPATGTIAIVALLALLPIDSTADAAADAAGAFATHCAGCHGPDGSSQTAMGKAVAAPDLRSTAVQQQPDSKFADVIANGIGTMPAFKSTLTDEQIQGLVPYLRQLAKKK
jgi:mono/diheme cytochrome c family protein